jgi:hypothetical protein
METLTIVFNDEFQLNAFLRWFKTQGLESFEAEAGPMTVDYAEEKNGLIQLIPTTN